MQMEKLATALAFMFKSQSRSFIIKSSALATPRGWKNLWRWAKFFCHGLILAPRKLVVLLLKLKCCVWAIIFMDGVMFL